MPSTVSSASLYRPVLGAGLAGSQAFTRVILKLLSNSTLRWARVLYWSNLVAMRLDEFSEMWQNLLRKMVMV